MSARPPKRRESGLCRTPEKGQKRKSDLHRISSRYDVETEKLCRNALGENTAGSGRRMKSAAIVYAALQLPFRDGSRERWSREWQ